MVRYTFVVEFEDGMEPEVCASTEIIGGKLIAVHWNDATDNSINPPGCVTVPIVPTKKMYGQIHPITEGRCPTCDERVSLDCTENVLMSWEGMLAVGEKERVK